MYLGTRALNSQAKYLTPLDRVFLEKLSVAQLLKRIHKHVVKPEANNRVCRSPPLVPILSQTNPFRTIPSYLSKIKFNIILPSTFRSSQWSISFWFGYSKVLLFIASNSWFRVPRDGQSELRLFRC
jgi:hypothetical protein